MKVDAGSHRGPGAACFDVRLVAGPVLALVGSGVLSGHDTTRYAVPRRSWRISRLSFNGSTTSRGSTELAAHSFFAADTSTQTTPSLPSWSAITVSEGALLSSTMVPPAATAAAIRCSATSGATYTSTWNR
jgi:hypothetical protein